MATTKSRDTAEITDGIVSVVPSISNLYGESLVKLDFYINADILSAEYNNENIDVYAAGLVIEPLDFSLFKELPDEMASDGFLYSSIEFPHESELHPDSFTFKISNGESGKTTFHLYDHLNLLADNDTDTELDSGYHAATIYFNPIENISIMKIKLNFIFTTPFC